MASVTPTSLLRGVLDQTAYNDKSPSHVTLASPSIERAYDSTTDVTPMKRMVEQRRADEKHRIDVEKVHNTEARRKQRDTRNRSNEALLHRAARVGDMKNVMKALDNGADVNCTGSNHDTALHVACINGEVDVVKYLLDKGAEIEAKSKSGQTPLMLAASGGHYHPLVTGGNEICAELLINKGARKEAKSNSGLTPLICAARAGKDKMLRLLVSKGCQLEGKDYNGRTALHWAQLMNFHTEAHTLKGTQNFTLEFDY